jgi:hypothetical protein
MNVIVSTANMVVGQIVQAQLLVTYTVKSQFKDCQEDTLFVPWTRVLENNLKWL